MVLQGRGRGGRGEGKGNRGCRAEGRRFYEQKKSPYLFWRCLFGPGEVLLLKKKKTKSCDNVPFRCFRDAYRR